MHKTPTVWKRLNRFLRTTPLGVLCALSGIPVAHGEAETSLQSQFDVGYVVLQPWVCTDARHVKSILRAPPFLSQIRVSDAIEHFRCALFPTPIRAVLISLILEYTDKAGDRFTVWELKMLRSGNTVYGALSDPLIDTKWPV